MVVKGTTIKKEEEQGRGEQGKPANLENVALWYKQS